MTNDEIIELMAEPAHNAWMQWYAVRGYTSRRAEWGEEFMVPFDLLSEDGKELDRVIMRSILFAFSEQNIVVTTEYETCKRRGHDADEGYSEGHINWSVCKWCGTTYRFEQALIER